MFQFVVAALVPAVVVTLVLAVVVVLVPAVVVALVPVVVQAVQLLNCRRRDPANKSKAKLFFNAAYCLSMDSSESLLCIKRFFLDFF